jgi:transcription initiation factor TFIID subunit 7
LSQRAAASSAPTKLKLSFKAGEASGARQNSFLGEYDRELDENPDEPLAFEEQFILRVPPAIADGRGNEVGLRDLLKGKGKGLDAIEFKFLDPRRGVFKINGTSYASKLVDLPNVIEAQKTLDSRHLFKVADISQMLVVGEPISNEASITASALNVDDYSWPHGITPPLRHVRKRRFRKRLSRRAIEVVEETVEELLKKDEEADSTTFGE